MNLDYLKNINPEVLEISPLIIAVDELVMPLAHLKGYDFIIGNHEHLNFNYKTFKLQWAISLPDGKKCSLLVKPLIVNGNPNTVGWFNLTGEIDTILRPSDMVHNKIVFPSVSVSSNIIIVENICYVLGDARDEGLLNVDILAEKKYIDDFKRDKNPFDLTTDIRQISIETPKNIKFDEIFVLYNGNIYVSQYIDSWVTNTPRTYVTVAPLPIFGKSIYKRDSSLQTLNDIEDKLTTLGRYHNFQPEHYQAYSDLLSTDSALYLAILGKNSSYLTNLSYDTPM